MLKLPALCGIPAPQLATCPPDGALSAGCKQVAQSLGSLRRFAQTLPYVLPAPANANNDPISTLLLNAQILQPSSQAVQPHPPNVEVSFHDSSLHINYRPEWFQACSTEANDVSETEYETPVHRLNQRESSVHDPENLAQHLKDSIDSVRSMLMSAQRQCVLISNALTAIIQDLISLHKEISQHSPKTLPETQWGPVINSQHQEEKDIFNELDIPLQSKIVFITIIQVSISIELYLQSERLESEADRQSLSICTMKEAESLLHQCTDYLALIFNDIESTLCSKDDRLALLEIATSSLKIFYSSACQLTPDTHPPAVSYKRYFLAGISHELLNRQTHLLLDLISSNNVSSAVCTDIMSIFLTILDDDQATTLLSEAISSPFVSNTQTSAANRSATEKLICSILEHAVDASVSIKDELYKPPSFYRGFVLPKHAIKPPPVLIVLTRLLTLPSRSSPNNYLMHPKLVLQMLLQQISTVTNQKDSMKSSLVTLTALSYRYMLELTISPNGASVLWKDLSPMIAAHCDKQFSSQLPSQAITTFIRLMLDFLAFLLLLALRNESSTQAAQCSSQLLSFFSSFFSIISKNVQLQSHIVSMLSRLSTALQLAKSSYMDASISLDVSTNFLQAIDSCLMDICIGALNSTNTSISLLDASLSSLIEPIQNGRFPPDSIINARLLPKLKDLLRTTGSLSLIKVIVQLFVLLVDRYYLCSQISTTLLAVQLNTIMTVIMGMVIFTRDNAIAMGIASILLPAMRATLPPIGTAWKDSSNSISRSTGLIICITSQNENRLVAFLRTVVGLADHHKMILRDIQREVLRILYGFLFKASAETALSCDKVNISTESVPFSQFHNKTLAIIFFNLCGLSIILADELGDGRENTVPLCASQQEQCVCKLMDKYIMTVPVELEPKVKCNAMPLYVKPSRSGTLRYKEKSTRQNRRGPDTSTVCSADTTAHMLLSITSMLTNILPNILQCAVLIESAATWIEMYIANDEHRKLFQAHALRIVSLGARVHVHCLFNAEKSGKLDGSSAHMTAGNLLDQYNSIMSLLCSMIDFADVYILEHVVSCLVHYAKWDLFYRGYMHKGSQGLYILCRSYVRICASSSRALVQAGYLKETSELFCVCLQSKGGIDDMSTNNWSIAKHLYLLALLARGFNQFNDKDSVNIRNILISILLPTPQYKTAVDGLHIAYSVPVIYVLRLLLALRASASDIVHLVAVCQYTLLGALPFMFIQSTDDAVAVLAVLKEDSAQPSLHPLIADAIFYATVKFFGTRITEDTVSSVFSSITSEDTDSESKISLASLSVSALKSPSSTTDYERPLTGVYISAKAEEKRLRVQKRFVHAILPYCHAILNTYYFKGLFPSSTDESTITTKTIVHVLYCMRQIITSKLILPEFILPNLIAFQLTGCYAHDRPSTMTIVYEDILDTLTLSMTVFKQVMCVVAVEKALQLLFITDEWRALVQRITNKNQIEAVLLSIQIPDTVLIDLYNIIFLENDSIGVSKQKDADALFVSAILTCLELPNEHDAHTDCSWHDTLLRLFFLLYILMKLPFCKHKSSVAVGTIIRHFSDYTVHQYQRILLLDSTGGETLPHTFVCDLFACLVDCIVKLFTYCFDYTIKGEKEEIAKEPRGSLSVLNDIARTVSQSIAQPDGTLKGLMDIRDSLS